MRKMAKVIDNNDPDKIGRVLVQILQRWLSWLTTSSLGLHPYTTTLQDSPQKGGSSMQSQS